MSQTHSSKPRYFIGLMSGTSVDGVDAALIDCSKNKVRLIDFIDHPLPQALTTQLITLNHSQSLSLNTLCQLEHDVAMQFVKATQALLAKTELEPKQITAIGSHGQTIFHAPHIPMSLQIGHPAFIAKQTGIDTVADFRIDDLAVGGQGAPLAPTFHQQLFSKNDNSTYVINIGGIANISYLDHTTGALYGFDSGPGNALMDELCQQRLNCTFDRNGDLAKHAQIEAGLLKQLLNHPYLSKPFPKSTGRETFNSDWLKNQLHLYSKHISDRDLLSTLCELTAQSIKMGVQRVSQQMGKGEMGDIWVVGGGAYNAYLINRLQHALPQYNVRSSIDAGINPNAVEAMMCGWLAQQRIDLKTIPLRAVTGATRNVMLGGLWSTI